MGIIPYFLEVNLERDREVHTFFRSNLKPQEIAARLGTYYGVPIEPSKKLLFDTVLKKCVSSIYINLEV